MGGEDDGRGEIGDRIPSGDFDQAALLVVERPDAKLHILRSFPSDIEMLLDAEIASDLLVEETSSDRNMVRDNDVSHRDQGDVRSPGSDVADEGGIWSIGVVSDSEGGDLRLALQEDFLGEEPSSNLDQGVAVDRARLAGTGEEDGEGLPSEVEPGESPFQEEDALVDILDETVLDRVDKAIGIRGLSLDGIGQVSDFSDLLRPPFHGKTGRLAENDLPLGRGVDRGVFTSEVDSENLFHVFILSQNGILCDYFPYSSG